MQLKYRAYIDSKFYYFELEGIARAAAFMCPNKISCDSNEDCENCNNIVDIINWLTAGNQPDVFTGYQDKNNVDIYTKDIVKVQVEDEEGYIKEIIHRQAEFGIDSSYRFSKNCPIIIPSVKNLSRLNECMTIIGNAHQNGDLLK